MTNRWLLVCSFALALLLYAVFVAGCAARGCVLNCGSGLIDLGIRIGGSESEPEVAPVGGDDRQAHTPADLLRPRLEPPETFERVELEAFETEVNAVLEAVEGEDAWPVPRQPAWPEGIVVPEDGRQPLR